MAKSYSLDELRDEYTLLFARMKLKPQRERDISTACQRIGIAAAKTRYMAVAAATGVPWFVVGIFHSLEASLRFDSHLHNGDPLKAQTVHDPKNRPPGWNPGPDQSQNWIVSAIDAIKHEKLEQQHDWSVAGIAFALEKFNGFGYRNNHPHVKNPYLWSYSNIYFHGKYVADGVFDEDAVSDQCGGMALLRGLIETDPSIKALIAFNDGHAEENEEAASRPFPGASGPEGTPAAHPIKAPPQYPGRYLLSGIEQDADVKLLQQRLNFLGFDTKGIDSDFGQDTEDAVKLFQLRSADPAGEPLDVDGVVGPQTWEALFGRESVPPRDELPLTIGRSALAAEVVAIAMSQLGVLEVPLGSNRGPEVDQYIGAVDPGLVSQRIPWCMCFVYWCFKEASAKIGTPVLTVKSAGVRDAWTKTVALSQQDRRVSTLTAREALRDPSKVKPGMVFFITRVGGGHTGIVISNDNGLLETIEGNTNNNGSAEGIGVFRRTKRRTNDDNVLGFASYDNAVAAVTPPGSAGFQRSGPALNQLLTTAQPATANSVRASNWIYQLQDIEPAEIANSKAELAVIDNMSGTNDQGARFFTPTEVAAMAKRPSGVQKNLVSYLSIGEAETYRPYWSADWKANPPAWLDMKGGENEQWAGNIKVRYWLTDWKRIIFGSDGASLDRIIAAGFNGAYLDIVDAFEFWEMPENSGRTGGHIDPRNEMVNFVLELAAYARNKKPGFLIIPQNGEALLRSPDYVAAINAIGIESLLYTGNGASLTTELRRTERIADLSHATAANRPVFAIEYVKHPSRIKNATTKLSDLGYIPYFGPKLLDELRSPWNVVA